MPIAQRPKSPIPAAAAPTITVRGEEQQPKKGLTPQARTYVAVGVLAFCLIVGAGIVWFFLWGSTPKRRTVAVDPGQQTVAMPGMRIAPQPPRNLKGVNKLANDRWLIRGDAGSVMVVAKGGAYEFRTVPQKDIGLSKEQIALLAGRFRILADPLMAKEWKITEDQTKRLRAIPMNNTGGQVNNADAAALRPLWDAYLKASDGSARLDAQKKLTDRVDGTAKSIAEAAKKVYLDRIEQIRQILTPEQIQAITK
jgi:hypothetical protein